MKAKTLAIGSPVLLSLVLATAPTIVSAVEQAGKRIHLQVNEPSPAQRTCAKNALTCQKKTPAKAIAAAGTTTKGKTSSSSQSSSSSHAETLTDDYNTMYFGSFTIGSNNQHFTGILDTGSSNVWVPGSNCTSSACQHKERFDQASSTTFTTKNQPLSITYGTGQMEGIVGSDSVTMGGLTVDNQGFGVASQLSDNFLASPFDGIFGLAYKSLAKDQVTPWMDNAVQQGLIDKAIFSFYLSNDPGKGDARLIIGEPDPDYYQGEIEWHPLQSLRGNAPEDLYYNITFDGIYSGNQQVPLLCNYVGSCKAIVDSGTSLIVGPSEDIENILNTLNLNPDCSNLNEQPSLNFMIGGNNYEVPPEFYVVKRINQTGQAECTPGLAPSNMTFWIFGDAFMRAFYTIFDQGESRVGFAKLASHLQTPEALRIVHH